VVDAAVWCAVNGLVVGDRANQVRLTSHPLPVLDRMAASVCQCVMKCAAILPRGKVCIL
jgi:hypothetical protein